MVGKAALKGVGSVNEQRFLPGRSDDRADVWKLVGSGYFDSFVTYASRDERWFAGGVAAELLIGRDSVQFVADGQAQFRSAGWAPLTVAGTLLKDHFPGAWRTFGYVSFDVAYLLHGAGRAPATDRALVHLIVPEVEVHWTAGGTTVRSSNGVGAERVADLLSSERELPDMIPRSVDLHRTDGADRDRFLNGVAAVQEIIGRGRLKKTVLSRRVPVPFTVDLLGSYLLGLVGQDPARSFLLQLGDFAAGGFSPEIVVAVRGDATVMTHPLAGTRPRTGDPDQDSRLAEELRWDVKECYEHLLSARLAYDEMSSICQPGSVSLRDFMRVEQRASVQHLGSMVSGRLADGVTMWAAAEALFPAITVSGVPKGDALEAIARIEDESRGIYGGAVLMADSDGNLDAALVLRTFIQEGGRCRLQAGAGIVSQSSPAREFEETCHKLRWVADHMVELR